jgi:hypothetical protein
MPLDAPPMQFEWAELLGHKLRKLRGLNDVTRVKYERTASPPPLPHDMAVKPVMEAARVDSVRRWYPHNSCGGGNLSSRHTAGG